MLERGNIRRRLMEVPVFPKSRSIKVLLPRRQRRERLAFRAREPRNRGIVESRGEGWKTERTALRIVNPSLHKA